MTYDPNATIAANEADFQRQLAALPKPNVVTLPRFSDRVRGLLAGTLTQVVWVMVGDSLTAGIGAGSRVGAGAGYRKDAALPAHVAHMLNAAGIPARNDAFFGDGNGVAADNAYPQAYLYGSAANADVEFPEGWQINGANLSFGGHFFGNGNNQAKATFYPQYPANRFDFFLIMTAGGAPMVVEDADGTVLATLSSDGIGLRRYTVTRSTNSTAAIRFSRGTASGAVYMQGIAPWSTVTPRVEIYNIGISGAQSQTFYQTTGNDFIPGKTMQALDNVDLFSVQLGQNEAAKTAAQFRTDMETLIAFLKAKSPLADIQLIKSHPVNAPATSIAADKLAALDAIATAQSLAVPISFNSGVLVDGRDYADAVHLAERGYRREAGYLTRQIATRI